MKRRSIVGLGTLTIGLPLAIAVVASGSFARDLPVLGNLREAGTKLAQTIGQTPTPQQTPAGQSQEAQVQLALTADKKVTQRDQQGKVTVTWQPLKGGAVVQPGDTLRYTVSGKNNSTRAVNNLVVTQPIPRQATYVLNSTTAGNQGTQVTYSINNASTFVPRPTVQVPLPGGKFETRPAPAELYTHVRWTYPNSIGPTATIAGTYQTRVR